MCSYGETLITNFTGTPFRHSDFTFHNIHCLLTKNFDIDQYILWRICLDSADVHPRVLPGYRLDDKDPIIVSLAEDGVAGISAERQVAHSQQVE